MFRGLRLLLTWVISSDLSGESLYSENRWNLTGFTFCKCIIIPAVAVSCGCFFRMIRSCVSEYPKQTTARFPLNKYHGFYKMLRWLRFYWKAKWDQMLNVLLLICWVSQSAKTLFFTVMKKFVHITAVSIMNPIYFIFSTNARYFFKCKQ